MKQLLTRSLALLLLSAPMLVTAHTTAVTSPKNGAVLAQSPPKIEITFEHEARLTSVIVVAADKTERKLTFAPTTSAKTFTITDANLAAGASEIQWKALSKDGHVVSGKLKLTVQAEKQAH
jgi:copper resistance protein C